MVLNRFVYTYIYVFFYNIPTYVPTLKTKFKKNLLLKIRINKSYFADNTYVSAKKSVKTSHIKVWAKNDSRLAKKRPTSIKY